MCFSISSIDNGISDVDPFAEDFKSPSLRISGISINRSPPGAPPPSATASPKYQIYLGAPSPTLGNLTIPSPGNRNRSKLTLRIFAFFGLIYCDILLTYYFVKGGFKISRDNQCYEWPKKPLKNSHRIWYAEPLRVWKHQKMFCNSLELLDVFDLLWKEELTVINVKDGGLSWLHLEASSCPFQGNANAAGKSYYFEV